MGKKPAKLAIAKTKVKEHICPKCGSRLELRDCRSIKINGVTYGKKGLFWCCTNTKQVKSKGEYYESQCDYEVRV
jgi:uncharacterized protein with PIN domain